MTKDLQQMARNHGIVRDAMDMGYRNILSGKHQRKVAERLRNINWTPGVRRSKAKSKSTSNASSKKKKRSKKGKQPMRSTEDIKDDEEPLSDHAERDEDYVEDEEGEHSKVLPSKAVITRTNSTPRNPSRNPRRQSTGVPAPCF